MILSAIYQNICTVHVNTSKGPNLSPVDFFLTGSLGMVHVFRGSPVWALMCRNISISSDNIYGKLFFLFWPYEEIELSVCSAVPKSCPTAGFGLPAYALSIFPLIASKECSIWGVHAWVQRALGCVPFPVFPFSFPWLLVDLWSVKLKTTSWMATKFPDCQWWSLVPAPFLLRSTFSPHRGWGGQKGCAAVDSISQEHMESLWRCFYGMTGQSCGWPALALVVVLLQLLGWVRDHQSSPPTDISMNLWHLFCWKNQTDI